MTRPIQTTNHILSRRAKKLYNVYIAYHIDEHCK